MDKNFSMVDFVTQKIFKEGKTIEETTQEYINLIDKEIKKELSKKRYKMDNFEIEPGIIISKLDIKDGDTLIITVDADIWDIDTASEICKMVSRVFPNNNIVTTFKGIEIEK
jgi:hypothetical protein